jgi:phosphopantetheinyl transferase
MKRFHFAKDSLLYCTAHVMKRILLSSYEPVCRPRQWRFIENPYGKPMVRSTPSGLPLHFNLSHSWPIVAVAISRRYSCGIDVEFSNDFTVQHEEMQAVLHPADRERIAKSTEKNRCFLDIWTQKEAAAKAVGSGLSWDFESFHVCPESGQVHCEPSLYIPVTARSIPTTHKQLFLAVGWIGNCGDPKLSTPKWLSCPQTHDRVRTTE